MADDQQLPGGNDDHVGDLGTGNGDPLDAEFAAENHRLVGVHVNRRCRSSRETFFPQGRRVSGDENPETENEQEESPRSFPDHSSPPPADSYRSSYWKTSSDLLLPRITSTTNFFLSTGGVTALFSGRFFFGRSTVISEEAGASRREERSLPFVIPGVLTFSASAKFRRASWNLPSLLARASFFASSGDTASVTVVTAAGLLPFCSMIWPAART